MTRNSSGIAALFLLVAGAANAEVRLQGFLDASTARIDAFGRTETFGWTARGGELEVGWQSRKLGITGFAAGIRKEAERLNDGTHLTLRAFTRSDLSRTVILRPSVGLVFGVPSGTFYRTRYLRTAADGLTDHYVHVFPITSQNIPYYDEGVERMGQLYPELSVSARFTAWRFNADPVVGVRFIEFGKLRVSPESRQYREQLALAPWVGVRVGFKVLPF